MHRAVDAFTLRVGLIRVVVPAGLFFATGLAGTPAEAQPDSGCPGGYTLMSVETLEATGHVPEPRRVDEAGNADGQVCALPLPDAICFANGYDPCPVDVVYLYKDNTLPR